MDAVALKELRDVEAALMQPLVAPEVVEDPEFELPQEDLRTGIIRRVGKVATPELVEIDQVLSASERTHLHFLYNLERFIVSSRNGDESSLLREHQHNVFEDIFSFLAHPKHDDNGEIQRRGYIKLPTGAGKTAIFSTLVNVLNRPLPESSKKPKALVLVPKLDLVSQTVGVDGQRGFAQFAQDTTVTEYHGAKKDLSGDAVVMSYQSLIGAVARGDVTEDDFDLIVCDEAHRALGDKTRQAIEQITNGNLLLGLTATPEFRDKNTGDLFGEVIHSMELREAIEMGLLSPIRCFAVTSDAEIETLKSGDFSEEELAQLIENQWRNQKAIEFAKSLIENGKSGIISCIPGEETKHAVEIADALNNEFITDPKTGELRRVRAVAVSGLSLDRQDIYEAFERGEIDVLTYVDVLTEGWDSTIAKFLINLRPTTSPVNAVQRLGRILRKSEDSEDIATVIEFIDKTDKQLYTFFHALGEETIEQGKRIGPKRTRSGEGPEGGDIDIFEDLPNLPKELLDKLSEINHVNIAELIVQSEDYELPNGVVSITRFGKLNGVGIKTTTNIMSELGIEPEVYRFGENRQEGFGVTLEQQELMLAHAYFKLPVADDSIKSIFALTNESGYGRTTIKNALEELDIKPVNYRFDNNLQGFPGLTEDQQEKVLSYLSSLTTGEEGVITLNEFVKKNNSSRPQILAIAKELGIEISSLIVKNDQGSGRLSPVLTSEQAGRILEHPHFLTPELTDDVVVISEFRKAYSIEVKKLQAILDHLEVKASVYRRGGQRVNTITQADAERVRAYIQETMPNAPDDVVSINALSREHGVTTSKLRRAAEELGLETRSYRFVFTKGAHMAIGFNRSECEQLVLYVQDMKRQAPKIEPGDDAKVISIYALADQLGVGEVRLRELISDLNIATGKYSFGSTIGIGVSREDVDRIKEHPLFSIPVASEQDMSTNQVAKQLGVEPVTIRAAMSELGISEVVMRNSRNRPVGYLTVEQVELIKTADVFTVEFVEGAKSVHALTQELQIASGTLQKILNELGIEMGRYKFKRGKSYSIGNGLNAEQQAELARHPFFSIPRADESTRNISEVATTLRTTKKTILRIAEERGISLREYKFGTSGKVNLGLSESEVRQIVEVLEGRSS